MCALFGSAGVLCGDNFILFSHGDNLRLNKPSLPRFLLSLACDVLRSDILVHFTSKTVIITGSQVPITEIRNDAIDNLLGALTIAGHFVIPEVSLYFSNKLFRGNRSSKMDAIDFNAFDSPNLPPLVKVGINIGKLLCFRLLMHL